LIAPGQTAPVFNGLVPHLSPRKDGGPFQPGHPPCSRSIEAAHHVLRQDRLILQGLDEGTENLPIVGDPNRVGVPPGKTLGTRPPRARMDTMMEHGLVKHPTGVVAREAQDHVIILRPDQTFIESSGPIISTSPNHQSGLEDVTSLQQVREDLLRP
jgi:hypothetical protein